MRPIFRIDPKLGPENFKTYQISAPAQTHFRRATCQEVECERYAKGFRSVIDVSTELGQQQAAYIEKLSGRTFTRAETGTIITYTFAAEQQCFTAHKVPLEREPFFIVRDGDYRGNPRGTAAVKHTRPEFWVEDFAEHQDGIARAHQKG